MLITRKLGKPQSMLALPERFEYFHSKNCIHFIREWDGLVRELLEQRADLAVADLTITFDREQVTGDILYTDCSDLRCLMNKLPLPGRRFHDAIHEFGHISFIPQASETTTKSILIPITIVTRCLDLYGDCLLGRFGAAFHSGAVWNKQIGISYEN